MRGHRGLLASPGLWFAIALSASAAFGVEKWRRNTARRATRAERARMSALVTCLLGDDGHGFARDVGRTRTRLRGLAMQTSLTPAPTWIDRCIPLADALAREGLRVDTTAAPTRAATNIAAPARDLARALRRVGLVWQVRAGDPDADLEAVAVLITRTSTEIDLADEPSGADRVDGPRAPALRAAPTPLRLPLLGARPLPVGDPSRFFVGAPLPTLSRVRVVGHRAEAEVVSNDDARAWRLRPHALVRVLGEDGAADGLAPLQVEGLDGPLGRGRMAAPPPGVPLSGVSLDATRWGDALWVAHAVRGTTPVIARMPSRAGEPTTAARLGDAPPGDSDAEVAVGGDGRAVFATHTLRAGDAFSLRAVRAGRGVRAAVLPVPVDPAAWTVPGRHPGLAMCSADDGLRVALTGRGRWVMGALRGEGLTVLTEVQGAGFDEIATLRCDARGSLLYGRDRPRASPMLWCAGGRCERLAPWSPPQPVTLPDWTVADLRGDRRTMPEWPLRVVRGLRGGFVAARAAGTVVAVTRCAAAGAAWEPERVVFDAAAQTPGERVDDVELYADGERVLLVIAAAGELRILRSVDGGARWEHP
ncbi:MAG: hypothetical protein U0325_14855 [Polyangiales bacterium]